MYDLRRLSFVEDLNLKNIHLDLDLDLGDRLKQFSDVWRNFRGSPKIYRLVKYGYKIKFLKG